MRGELHIKPVGYNCPCNIGRRSWRECHRCERLRLPRMVEEERTSGWYIINAIAYSLAAGALGAVALAAALWWQHG